MCVIPYGYLPNSDSVQEILDLGIYDVSTGLENGGFVRIKTPCVVKIVKGNIEVIKKGSLYGENEDPNNLTYLESKRKDKPLEISREYADIVNNYNEKGANPNCDVSTIWDADTVSVSLSYTENTKRFQAVSLESTKSAVLPNITPAGYMYYGWENLLYGMYEFTQQLSSELLNASDAGNGNSVPFKLIKPCIIDTKTNKVIEQGLLAYREDSNQD